MFWNHTAWPLRRGPFLYLALSLGAVVLASTGEAATGGSTRFYLHAKDNSEKNSNYNAMLPSVLPEGDTQVSGSDNSQINFTAAPCEAAGFDQDTTALVNEETAGASAAWPRFSAPCWALRSSSTPPTPMPSAIRSGLPKKAAARRACCGRGFTNSSRATGPTTSSAPQTVPPSQALPFLTLPVGDAFQRGDGGCRKPSRAGHHDGYGGQRGRHKPNRYVNVHFDRPATAPAYVTMSYTAVPQGQTTYIAPG